MTAALNPALNPAPKRTREGTSKSRTGCTTCKPRRIKCDEARPVCRGCAFSRRRCECNTAAHELRRQRKIQIQAIYVAPAKSQPVLFLNERGVDFFQQNFASRLGGQFDSAFWTRLVLQLSHSVPSVRYALSAIGIVCRDLDLSLRHPAGYVGANPEGERQWNLAVQSLRVRMRTNPTSSFIPLVCCLLFTCIEFLKGNDRLAMLHIMNGFSIPSTFCAALESGRGRVADLESIKEHIVPVFTGLNVLCSTISS